MNESKTDHERLFLTGYMGAGKSTIGWRLAQSLGYRFLDTDRQIVKQFKKPIAKIFQMEGETAFRLAENKLLEELALESQIVISTGGGTLTREETFSIAHGNGTVIYLKAPVEILYERAIFSRKDRPMLDVPNSERVFKERFDQREHFYNRSHVIIETHGKRPDDVVQEILASLGIEQVEGVEG